MPTIDNSSVLVPVQQDSLIAIIQDSSVSDYVEDAGYVPVGENIVTSEDNTTWEIVIEEAVNKKYISESDAYAIACEYWSYSENAVDEETGYPLTLVSDGLMEGYNNRECYVFRLRWFVPSTGITSTVEYLHVDAETGEVDM